MQAIMELRRMNAIKRCALYHVIKPTSDAEHSYHVAMIAKLIVEDLKSKGVEVDELKVLNLALIHDVEEIIISDVPWTIKKDERVKDALSKVVIDKVSGVFPFQKWLQDAIVDNCYFKPILSLEEMIVKAADAMELVTYCIDEMNLGNNNLEEIYSNAVMLASLYTKQIGSDYLYRIVFEEQSDAIFE